MEAEAWWWDFEAGVWKVQIWRRALGVEIVSGSGASRCVVVSASEYDGDPSDVVVDHLSAQISKTLDA